MALLGDIIKGGGTLLGVFSDVKRGEAAESYYDSVAAEKERVAETNREISLYDASVAEKDAFYAEQSAGIALSIHMRKLEGILGTQKARYAKSGVVPGSGSPLDVSLQTLLDGLKDAEIIAYNGQTAAERRRSLAARYRLLAEKGLRDAAASAALLEDAGAAEKEGWLWSGAGRAVGGFYELAKDWGWIT